MSDAELPYSNAPAGRVGKQAKTQEDDDGKISIKSISFSIVRRSEAIKAALKNHDGGSGVANACVKVNRCHRPWVSARQVLEQVRIADTR